MKKSICVIVFPVLFLFGLGSRTGFAANVSLREKSQAPYIKYSYQVLLSAGMLKALKEYNPTFRLLKMEDFSGDVKYRSIDKFENPPVHLWSNLSCYSAVFGNFNDDGKFDAVVLGEVSVNTGDAKYLPVYAVLSEGATNYRVIEVTRVEAIKPVTVYLAVHRQRHKKRVYDANNPLIIKEPAISDTPLLYNRNGVTEYYWDELARTFKENLPAIP